MKRIRLAIFASGNGSNAEAIMVYFQHHADIEVTVLLTNNAEAFAIERAKKFGIATRVFDRRQFVEDNEVLMALHQLDVTHIALAGFLWLIPEKIVIAFPGRIINIHPSLLPKFGGKGMYGIKVHEAVKASGETRTGLTIHLVNSHYDDGAVLAQAICEVLPSDLPQDIARRVNELEYRTYPPVIERWALS